MACPLGFGRHNSDDDGDVESSEGEIRPEVRRKQGGLAGAGAGAGAADDTAPTGDDRFNYDKDPVSWFFQNQIKSEEEFQARKAELRAAARQRLDAIFEAKGKRLLVDSDDDDFSAGSSELSAWDSDVASISSLTSCAREWREEAHFSAPAEAALQLALFAVAGAACYTCWTSFRAMMAVNRYWGIIQHGWVPTASFVVAAALAAAAACCWLTMARASKRCLLAFQVALQLAYVAAAALALYSFVMPAAIDQQLKSSAACKRRAPVGRDAASHLCSYLPAIEAEVKAHVAAILGGCACEAAAVAAALALSAWYAFEVAFVEKKAHKHKRRRRQRKHGIPWDKIKVEDMQVTKCGGGGGAARGGKAQGAAGAAAAAGAGRCPFAGALGAMDAAAGEPMAAAGEGGAAEPKKTI